MTLIFFTTLWMEYITVVLLYLTSAFDCMDPEILCGKLGVMVFSHGANEWISSFLRDRSQLVLVDGSSSEETITPCGSPQGSALSPLLFLLYVADLPLWTNAAVVSCADDTTIALSGNNVSTLFKRCWTRSGKSTPLNGVELVGSQSSKNRVYGRE